MPRLTFSKDGNAVRAWVLGNGHYTIGRRPDNRIVLGDLSVSGQHAELNAADGTVTIGDCGSTNGTFVNGVRVTAHVLADGDSITIGRYEGLFQVFSASAEQVNVSTGGATGMRSSAPLTLLEPELQPVVAPVPRLRVLSGAAAGREVPLVKPVTTLGKRGVSVVAIKRTAQGYVLMQVSGNVAPQVNAVAVSGTVALRHRDQITLGGARLEYLDS